MRGPSSYMNLPLQLDQMQLASSIPPWWEPGDGCPCPLELPPNKNMVNLSLLNFREIMKTCSLLNRRRGFCDLKVRLQKDILVVGFFLKKWCLQYTSFGTFWSILMLSLLALKAWENGWLNQSINCRILEIWYYVWILRDKPHYVNISLIQFNIFYPQWGYRWQQPDFTITC